MSKSGGSQEVLALRGRDLLSQPRKRVVRCDGRGDAGRSMLESPCHVRPLERPSRKFRRVSTNAHRAAPFRAAMAETAALQQDQFSETKRPLPKSSDGIIYYITCI